MNRLDIINRRFFYLVNAGFLKIGNSKKIRRGIDKNHFTKASGNVDLFNAFYNSVTIALAGKLEKLKRKLEKLKFEHY